MLGSLIAGLVSGETLDAARRARRAAIFYLIAGIFGMVGIGFFVGAGYVAAARRFGAIEAAVGFGVAFLLVALLVLGVHMVTARTRARSKVDRRHADMATIAGAAAVSLLPSLLRGRSGIGGIIWPALAVFAYAVYRENVKPDKGDKTTE